MLSSVAGTKRKSSDGAGAEAPPVDLNDIHIPDGLPMESCQVVRGKISRFLEAGEMKVGEFCNAIGVSGNAYRRFMASNGKDKGMFSDVYPQAWAFFKKRELAGIKPVKKRKSATGASESDKLLDLSQVHVDGEENDCVQVYDSCDEIRRKIAAHLRKPGVTRAQFCRDLLAQYHTSEKKPGNIQSAQLTRFMGQKGPDSGNTSSVFYASYVYFEKLRLKEGKPKSKHREEMENIWASSGGFDIHRNHSGGYLCASDKRPFVDSYGRVSFH